MQATEHWPLTVVRSQDVLKVGFEHNLEKILRFFEVHFKVKMLILSKLSSKQSKENHSSHGASYPTELTEAAEDGAIQLFSDNLRHLLLIAPLKGRGYWALTQPSDRS